MIPVGQQRIQLPFLEGSAEEWGCTKADGGLLFKVQPSGCLRGGLQQAPILVESAASDPQAFAAEIFQRPDRGIGRNHEGPMGQ